MEALGGAAIGLALGAVFSAVKRGLRKK